jgi:hypothetical protein
MSLPAFVSSAGPPGMARPSNYGFRLTGYLRAPAAGSYTFLVSVDDVARVFVNDVAVGGATWGNAQALRVTLVAGFNKLVAHVINAGGPASFNMLWDEGSGNVSVAWAGWCDSCCAWLYLRRSAAVRLQYCAAATAPVHVRSLPTRTLSPEHTHFRASPSALLPPPLAVQPSTRVQLPWSIMFAALPGTPLPINVTVGGVPQLTDCGGQSATVDPGSLALLAGENTTLTVPGGCCCSCWKAASEFVSCCACAAVGSALVAACAPSAKGLPAALPALSLRSWHPTQCSAQSHTLHPCLPPQPAAAPTFPPATWTCTRRPT